jgi:hypothetical protein
MILVERDSSTEGLKNVGPLTVPCEGSGMWTLRSKRGLRLLFRAIRGLLHGDAKYLS